MRKVLVKNCSQENPTYHKGDTKLRSELRALEKLEAGGATMTYSELISLTSHNYWDLDSNGREVITELGRKRLERLRELLSKRNPSYDLTAYYVHWTDNGKKHDKEIGSNYSEAIRFAVNKYNEGFPHVVVRDESTSQTVALINAHSISKYKRYSKNPSKRQTMRERCEEMLHGKDDSPSFSYYRDVENPSGKWRQSGYGNHPSYEFRNSSGAVLITLQNAGREDYYAHFDFDDTDRLRAIHNVSSAIQAKRKATLLYERAKKKNPVENPELVVTEYDENAIGQPTVEFNEQYWLTRKTAGWVVTHPLQTHLKREVASKLIAAANRFEQSDKFKKHYGNTWTGAKQNPRGGITLTLLDSERKHITQTEKRGLTKILEAGFNRGRVGKKDYYITERKGDVITVEIYEKARRESTGKMEWSKNTAQLRVKGVKENPSSSHSSKQLLTLKNQLKRRFKNLDEDEIHSYAMEALELKETPMHNYKTPFQIASELIDLDIGFSQDLH